MEVQSSNSLSKLPQRLRSSYSNKFKSISILTNHYHVNIGNFDDIYIFKIKITPAIIFDNSKLRNIVISNGINQICQFIKNPVISGLTIYTVQTPLEKQRQIKVQVEGNQYILNIKLVKEFNIKLNPKVLIQFLNNGLRNIMNKLQYVEIGRTNKFFSTKNKTTIDSLVMYSGYKSNFVYLEKGIFLRVDTAKKIVRNQSVLSIIDQLYKIHGDKQKDQKREIVRNELIGKVVMANYGKTRYYKIQDIIYKDMSEIILDNVNQNIADYYQEKYQISFKKKQPLLQVQNKNRNNPSVTYLIPQLCLMTGIPDNFDEFRRKKISENTIKSAGDRKNQIHQLINLIKTTPESGMLNDIGIKISDKMQTIQAKIIPAPIIALGNNNSIQDGKESFFNLYSKPIYSNKHSIKLGLIYFEGVDIRAVMNCFQSTCKNLDVDMEMKKLRGGQLELRKALSIIQKLIQEAVQKQCNVCLIIIPYNLKQQYKKIKSMALVNRKIICQVAVDSTLGRKNAQSIYTKILLQIIAKRGNTLWVPKSSHKYQKVMIIAYDSSKSSNGKICLSICGTANSTFTSIFSQVKTYQGNSQRFQPMVELFLNALDYYINRNKQNPSEVIVFHNSCSFDQVSLFRNHFIDPIITKMDSLFAQKRPLLTFITINTKSSERLFSQMQGYNSVKNVPAGTIVAKDIVSMNYDFYMVSQFTPKGSTVPNHYEVIYSDSKMEEGVLQELIFGQCFNYVNWTGSIKIPGILQYAKKCAKFNADVLENKEIPQDLQSKLYYI